MFNNLRFVIFLINTLTIHSFVNLISAQNDTNTDNLGMNIKSTLSLTATFSNEIMEQLCNTCTCEKASTTPFPTTDFILIGPFTWFESWKVCQGFGGHLAVPENEKEMNVIVNYLQRLNSTEAFIGIHDLFEEGRFVTVHGTSFVQNAHIKWSTSPKPEPDNLNNQDCCSLSMTGLLSDNWCTEKKHALCQRYKYYC